MSGASGDRWELGVPTSRGTTLEIHVCWPLAQEHRQRRTIHVSHSHIGTFCEARTPSGIEGCIKTILPDTRAYDGFEAFSVGQDVKDENRIVLVEHWASKEHYEKYIAWRTETGVMDQLMGMVTQPPTLTLLNDTGI